MMRRCCESEKWEYTDLFWTANLISSTPLQKDALAIDMPKKKTKLCLISGQRWKKEMPRRQMLTEETCETSSKKVL